LALAELCFKTDKQSARRLHELEIVTKITQLL